MSEQDIEISKDVQEYFDETKQLAQTWVLLSFEKKIVGFISISDPVKLEAPRVVSLFKSMCIHSILWRHNRVVPRPSHLAHAYIERREELFAGFSLAKL